jgi:hypothetical protein
MALPLHGIALQLIRVVASITLAGAVFYLSCRMLHIEELSEAANAVGARFFKGLRKR